MAQDVSIVTGKTNVFGMVDYLFFVAVLATSAIIGFYFAWLDRKKVTIKEYMLAGGNMQTMPVALSLVASFMSAITLLGTPVEMYQYSTVYIYIGISYVLVMAAAAHIYIPIFYLLGITSSFEYLQMRFGTIIRTAAAVIYIFQMMLYMSIVLYAPSLALNAVTNFPLWGAIGSVGAVCTLYTAMGGMKAVLWTDCFQVAMMMAGYAAVLIQGSIKVGGFARAWEIMDKSGRIIFNDFNPDPTVRHTFWSLVFGGYCVWVAVYGVNQAMVQRACSLPTLRRAQIAFWLNAPGLNIILIFGCLIGVVIYAFYNDCDPKKAGLIGKNDQLLPLFVMDVLAEVPGLPGLFVAGLFSGALSTISSGLNAVAAVVLQDFVRTFCVKGISDSVATRVSQMLALFFGAVCLALTWVASKLGNVLQAALSFYGMLSGPLLSLFTLGMIFPMANEWGALAGFVCSLIIGFTMGIGNFVHKPPAKPAKSPVHISGCTFLLERTNTTTTTTPPKSAYALDVSPLFSVSYLWYGFYAVICTIIVGVAVSYLTGPQRPEKLDPRLICPIFDIMPPFRYLPEHIRRLLRFGVVHEGKYDQARLTETKRLSELEALGKMVPFQVYEMSVDISEPGSVATAVMSDIMPSDSRHFSPRVHPATGAAGGEAKAESNVREHDETKGGKMSATPSGTRQEQKRGEQVSAASSGTKQDGKKGRQSSIQSTGSRQQSGARSSIKSTGSKGGKPPPAKNGR